MAALAPPIQASRFAVEARYGVAEWEGAKTLVRAERLRDADQNHLVVSLASPIEAITFEVFDGKQWRSEWPPANRLVGVALRVGLSTVAASETRTFALAPMEWTP